MVAELQDRPLTAVDMFAGPGGFSLGLASAGFTVLAAVEHIKSCVDTYRRNHPETTVILEDIRKVNEQDVVAIVEAAIGTRTVDLVTGGPPCETFSTAGPGIRSTRDHRDHLFRDMIRIAKALNAKYILIENIPGFRTKKGHNGDKSGIFNEVLSTLGEAGYSKYDWRILNAVNFGVPQYRERLFILATSDPDLPLSFPTPTHGVEKASPAVSVEEALSDLPLLANNEAKYMYGTSFQNEYQRIMRCKREVWYQDFVPLKNGEVGDFIEELTLHKSPKHRDRTIERFKMIGPGEGLKNLMTRLDQATLSELQNRGVLPNKWYIQRDRRLLLNEPSPTVTSHCLDELLHPTQHRHISPREAARLQSFPDWYYFEGPWVIPHIHEQQDKYEQIGDAVPPLLARALAKEIAGLLRFGGNGRYERSSESQYRQLDLAAFLTDC